MFKIRYVNDTPTDRSATKAIHIHEVKPNGHQKPKNKIKLKPPHSLKRRDSEISWKSFQSSLFLIWEVEKVYSRLLVWLQRAFGKKDIYIYTIHSKSVVLRPAYFHWIPSIEVRWAHNIDIKKKSTNEKKGANSR